MGCSYDFEKIIPDGSPEIIVHLGSPFEERTNGVVRKQQSSFLYGQLLSSIEIRPSTYPRVLGIKFHPFGLSAFSDIPQFELSGKTTPIDEIFSPFLVEQYVEKLHSTTCTNSLFLQTDHVLLQLLRKRKNFSQYEMARMQSVVGVMQKSNGSMKIGELTASLNIGRRELERKCNRYIGLSPKQLAKIFRLQFALQSKSKAALLTHLALEAGYYDQAHFIKEFSSIVNERPSDYFALQNELTEKFLLK